MSEKATSETTGWTQLLDQLGQTPDGALQKDAAWEKLHGRLKSKRQRTPLIGYRAAAAVALLFGLTIFFTRRQEPSRSDTVRTVEKKLPASGLANPEVKGSENSSTYPKEQKSGTPSRQRTALHASKPATLSENIHESVPLPSLKGTGLVAQVRPLVVPSPVSPGATHPATRELRVVSVNEIGDWPEEEPVVQNGPIHHHIIEFNLADQVNLNSSGGSAPATGFTLIKGK